MSRREPFSLDFWIATALVALAWGAALRGCL